MTDPNFPQAQLRTRFILVTCWMLLPLVIMAGVAFFSLYRLNQNFQSVVEETLDEKESIVHLQLQIESLGTPLHRYLIFSETEDREQFRILARDVDRLFTTAAALPFGVPSERDLLAAVQSRWGEVSVKASELMARPGELGEASLAQLRKIEAELEEIGEGLNSIHEIAESEIGARRTAVAAVNRTNLLLIASVCCGGLLIAIGSGWFLARSVLQPVLALRRGVGKLATGNLAYRVEMQRPDELGALVADFNGMAETLEKQQKALHQISVRDPLTGLFNHREFFRHLREELLRARRYSHPLTLLMFDLDYFKQVNDSYGHLNGDSVLRGLAQLLRRQLRTSDILARYGGEEFAVLLPETDGRAAFELAGRIRQALSEVVFDFGEVLPCQVTVSIGVAAFPGDAEREEALVSRADQALYAAKHAGRDRVCWRDQCDGPGPTSFAAGTRS